MDGELPGSPRFSQVSANARKPIRMESVVLKMIPPLCYPAPRPPPPKPHKEFFCITLYACYSYCFCLRSLNKWWRKNQERKQTLSR